MILTAEKLSCGKLFCIITCHLAIGRDSPNGRKIQKKPDKGKVESIPKLGGLVHRYEWKKAA